MDGRTIAVTPDALRDSVHSASANERLPPSLQITPLRKKNCCCCSGGGGGFDGALDVRGAGFHCGFRAHTHNFRLQRVSMLERVRIIALCDLFTSQLLLVLPRKLGDS
jgi:hypothetical protein